MIDPVLFTIPIINVPIYWYGALMSFGVFTASWITAREVHHRGEDEEYVWDGLVWALPAGIIGARLWYVVNDILGGGSQYLENPMTILYTRQGGLHFYGAVLFGGLAAYVYIRRKNLDMRLLLDAVAPALLVGQAVVRPANYINQELYGPPTDLPWGIPIEAGHRIPPWNDLARFPEETTRFHPAFAYEMIWNFLATGVLLWIARRFEERLKPGTIFAGWLILAGVGREFIEFFRPDQPRVPGTAISYTRIVAGLMTIVGLVWLLVKYEVINLPLLSSGPASYVLTSSASPSQSEPDQAGVSSNSTSAL